MKKIQHYSFIIFYFLIGSSAGGQIFEADPGIQNPEIYFLNDSVLIVEYESMYDIHMSWDTVTYPGAGLSETKFGKYDYFRLTSDLMTALDLREYHFAPVWGDDDLLYGMVEHPISGVVMNRMPGWIHFGRGNGYRAMNIGRDNKKTTLGPLFPEWGKLKQMPHMNNVAQLDRSSGPLNDKYGLSATLFHEIGHLGSAHFMSSPATPLGWTPTNWEPWMPPLALVNGGGHWWTEQSNRWVNPVHSGLMPSAPRYLSYNWIDLYALGILNWEQIVDSVAWVRDPNTMIEYDVRREDLVDMLEQYEAYMNDTPFEDLPVYLQDGDDYMEGNGIRIPNGDPSMLDLKTLLVVVLGQQESIFDENDQQLIMRMAREVPEDWSTATHGMSQMSTKITHKRINHFSKTLSGHNSVKINTEDFLNAFSNYQEAVLTHIRFETLPAHGTLNIDGIPVTIGVEYPINVITNQDLEYHKKSTKGIFPGDSFEYNAKCSSRWAAPATITITDDGGLSPFPGIIADNTEQLDNVIVYPNSFDQELHVSFQNDEVGDVEVHIFDLSGRRIYQKLIKSVGKGKQLILLDQLPKTNQSILNMTIITKSQSVSRKLINKK